MTSKTAEFLRRLIATRLLEIREERISLEQVLRDLSQAAPAESQLAPAPAVQTAAPVADVPANPLKARCEVLREQHGPVFVIHPSYVVAPGQRITWGKVGNEKQVEILEPAELPDDTGKVVPGRWFAKLIDV